MPKRQPEEPIVVGNEDLPFEEYSEPSKKKPRMRRSCVKDEIGAYTEPSSRKSGGKNVEEREGQGDAIKANIVSGKNKGKNKATVNSFADKHCPVNGCDSKGHLSGRLDSHRTISACPLYHNTTAEECKRRFEERERVMVQRHSEREKTRTTLRTVGASEEQRRRRQEAITARLFAEVTEATREAHRKHHETYGTQREPLVDGLASDADVQLFQLARQLASAQQEYEISQHCLLSSKKEYRVKRIEMGRYEMETWYASPYPEEYTRLPKLYVCEFCLKYSKTGTVYKRHMAKCVWRHPPGDEIYRKENISFFEVDGNKNKIYCQNLCLLAKLFLDHKTLYFDVEPFLFYVMTLNNETGCHMIGYFSKEKTSLLNYNVSCILTLPNFMRNGYGKMLIDFSYLLSRVEGKPGSPERPLSDLGLITYRSYWRDVLLRYLHTFSGSQVSLKEISQETGINPNDLVSTLQALGMLKYWKGKHIVIKSKELIDDWLEKQKNKPATRLVDPAALYWIPPAKRGQTAPEQ